MTVVDRHNSSRYIMSGRLTWTAMLLLLLVVSMTPTPSAALVEEAIDIIKLGKEVTVSILETWDIIEQTHMVNEVDVPFYKKKEKKILSRMTELSRQMDIAELEANSQITWTIEKINENANLNTQLHLGLHELSDLINRIATQQNLMRAFAEHTNDLEHTTLENFALWIVSPGNNAVQGLLDRVHLLLTGSPDLAAVGSNGVLYLVNSNLQEAKAQVCATRQSAQQVLYQLYSAISLTELKGYAMMQFSWMLLKSYGKGNYTRESQLMRELFVNRTGQTQELLRNVMTQADRSVWRCDPTEHKEGTTYEAVTRLLQGYIENEVDMNSDETCRENCATYEFAENHGCFKDLFCSKQPRCTGKLLNCQYIDSDMWICPSRSISTRRYEYIEYENGRTLGQRDTCTRGTTKVDSWWRYLFWHCSYCLCMCDEQGVKSDRYFNMRESVSDIDNNKVITGLRFRKVNRIIHMQIQEGELMPRGGINSTSVQWKPVADYRILDRGIRTGKDYHTMAWDKRAMDLDDLIAPEQHVVTGIRFRTLGGHLNLEIRITEADFVTGKLINPTTTSYWHSNDNTGASLLKRTQVKLNKPDVPTRSRSKSEPTSTSNQYIEFTHTDVDADVAQTTVPYLDAQDVTSIPPVALAGVGLFHKGQRGFGGFVAPKLLTYDFAPHIEKPEPTRKK